MDRQTKQQQSRMRSIVRISALLLLSVMTTVTTHTVRAVGDQFLDGIGETALIARYLFDGNLDDWSRNSLHADMGNRKAVYVEDDQFGRVLSLSGTEGLRKIQLPNQILSELENFSFTGWFKLDDPDRSRCFLYIRDDADQFSCMWSINADKNPEVGILMAGLGDKPNERASKEFPGEGDKWFHLSVVQNVADRKLTVYVDGKRLLESRKISRMLTEMLSAMDSDSFWPVVGGIISMKYQGFAGQLHDVRFYRTALTDRQVAVIHHNAISEDKWGMENTEETAQDAYRGDHARQLTTGLIAVQDVEIETTVGQLPHLPIQVGGIYADGKEGPSVRVIWPAPRDNSDVMKPGEYSITGSVPGTGLTAKAMVTVRNGSEEKPPQEASVETFLLGQVVLNPDSKGNPTPFMQHRDKFLDGLAKSDPNTFLYNFRDAFGVPQPDGTEPLYGWDSQTCRLRGHASGHYLTAIAQACASTTYDPELHAVFEQKMNTMIDVLYDLSQRSGHPAKGGGPAVADPLKVPKGPGKDGYDSDLSKEQIRTDYWNWGEGFISAYPPDQFIMLEQGASYGAGNNQIWAPYYTLHKILAGLMDCYEVGGNPKALEVAKGMGLWVYTRLDALPPETRIRMWNSYIAGEYGGMNEAMARLFLMTADERFLKCAKLFDNTEFFFGDAEHSHGLARNVDTIRGRHANQHIPQITGALETYRSTQDPAYFRVAGNFWEQCTHGYMYSIGGVAGARKPNNAECFTAEPDTLFRNGLSDGGQNETCATYNLLKLGRRLFMFEPDATYMDYYERALYNHILASVAEHDAGNTYHVPLNPGAVKSFGNAQMNSFTCCNGTALESATKLQNTIYLKADDDSALYVNLYIPSTLDWTSRKIRILQKTDYPYDEKIRLTVSGEGAFAMKLRIPEWIEQPVEVLVNGIPVEADTMAGEYYTINRAWKDRDTVELKLPMNFHLMPLMDQPNIASIFYGPVLLAAEEAEPRTSWRTITLDPDDIGASFSGDPATLRFESDGVRFKPFFETYDRHSVYLDIATPKTLKHRIAIQVIDPPEKDFFAKLLDFHGIPIKSSAVVEDRALYAAYERLDLMMANLPEVLDRLARKGAELHIIGRNEVTTDLPEFRDMKGVKIPEYGGLTYDERTRGLGGLITSCGEENLLKLPDDRYRGSDICIHEFSHNVMNHGSDPEVGERFEAQRRRSLEKGLWVDSYAGSNVQEFFAELAMWYFGSCGDVRMKGPAPAAGTDGLKIYDPEAYQLVDDFWSGRLTH